MFHIYIYIWNLKRETLGEGGGVKNYLGHHPIAFELLKVVNIKPHNNELLGAAGRVDSKSGALGNFFLYIST